MASQDLNDCAKLKIHLTLYTCIDRTTHTSQTLSTKSLNYTFNTNLYDTTTTDGLVAVDYKDAGVKEEDGRAELILAG